MEVICGGTFDRFHKGHEKLLQTAASLGHITVGIVSDDFIKKTKKIRKEIIQPYSKRKKIVENFLKKEKVKFKLLPIDDIYGDSSDEKYQAIVVSNETRKNAEKINEKRISKNINPLLIIEVPFVKSERGSPISSTDIRLGYINREGKIKKAPGTKNQIRQNLIELLKKESNYGYEIQKKYEKQFGNISLRLLYYHLKVGEEEGLWRSEIKTEKSNASWGNSVERKYYFVLV